jgi:hypothetical protein
MKGVTTLWDNVWFLAWESEAEAEGFETDWTLVFIVESVVCGYDREGGRRHCSVRMVIYAV